MEHPYVYKQVDQMEIITLRGEEILPFLDAVADLRIKIFRDWPYLYEGDIETEKNYLKIYAESEDSLLVLARDGELAVGVAMGLPMGESMEQVQSVFVDKGVPMESCYYFGDAILLKEYRKKGIGLKMIQDFEHAVKKLATYEQIYFCEIIRDGKDPRKPTGYQSLDSFWESQGYQIVPSWHVQLKWRAIGDREKTSHLLRFRKKPVHS